ncbi:MAG: sigma-E factor negative regulatory protein [Gammaproteobacteria bacterium]
MSEQISEQIREQLSALVDDELPVAEQRLLLERLAREPALRAQWTRYQLIRDSLHQSLPPFTDPGFAERVMAAVEAQPTHQASRPPSWARALRPAAGLAVAATVAVIAVLAVQPSTVAPPGAPGASGVQVAVSPAPPERYARLAPVPAAQSAQSAERLNEYLVNHSEYAASGGMPGMLPHVRIVGYERD